MRLLLRRSPQRLQDCDITLLTPTPWLESLPLRSMPLPLLPLPVLPSQIRIIILRRRSTTFFLHRSRRRRNHHHHHRRHHSHHHRHHRRRHRLYHHHLNRPRLPLRPPLLLRFLSFNINIIIINNINNIINNNKNISNAVDVVPTKPLLGRLSMTTSTTNTMKTKRTTRRKVLREKETPIPSKVRSTGIRLFNWHERRSPDVHMNSARFNNLENLFYRKSVLFFFCF